MKDSRRMFGHIPNVPVFAPFKNREQCSQAWVHRPHFSGIAGNGRVGTYSIVLSDGYEDDEDWGDVIIYTGAGGKNKWTDKVQIMDQSWNVHPNKALRTSYYTERPVRVIRSSHSNPLYAPPEGYRYDGLYQITDRWTAEGRSGFDTCFCQLERLPGQTPLSEILQQSMDPENGESVEDNAIEDDVDMGEESETD